MAAEEQQAKVKLHWLDGSRAQSIVWLLEELGVSYELELHHRQKSMLAPPELERIHPLGKSPVVTVIPPGDGDGDGGAGAEPEPVVLAESPFIAQYLCEHFAPPGGTALVPRKWKEGREGRVGGETEEWLRYQYLLYYIEGSLMPVLVMHLVMTTLKGPQIPFFIRPISSAIAGKVIGMMVLPNMKKHFALLESYLEKAPGAGGGAGDYLCGAHLTAADILIGFPLIGGRDSFKDMGRWDRGTPQATYPRLFAYIDRLEAEPGWKKSAEKIRELDGKFYVTPQPQ